MIAISHGLAETDSTTFIFDKLLKYPIRLPITYINQSGLKKAI